MCTDRTPSIIFTRRSTRRKELEGKFSLFGSPFSNASGSLAFDEDAATILPGERVERKRRKFRETRKFRRKVVLSILL